MQQQDFRRVWNPEPDSTVQALSASGKNIYAGGRFRIIGGKSRNRLACIDTTGIVKDWDPNAGDATFALSVSGRSVYVGGQFTCLGGKVRNNIACLDAITGAATDWNPDANHDVFTISGNGNNIFVSGDFRSIGGQSRNGFACIDATTGLATDLNPTIGGNIYALAVSGNSLYMGGNFRVISGQTRQYIACIDVTAGLVKDWNPDANGPSLGSIRAITINGNRVYVGGLFNYIDGQPRNNIACLEIETGHVTEWNPNADSMVLTLSVSGDKIYAGGHFLTIGGKARNRIACLDTATGFATNWDPDANGFSAHVNSISVIENNILVGGYFESIGGELRSRIACIDGITGIATDWYPGATDEVNVICKGDNQVYIGGNFGNIGGMVRSRIAQFDFISSSVYPDITYSISNSFLTSPPNRNIRYSLAKRSPVSLRIFDIKGRQIASLVNHIQSPGTYTISLASQSLPAGFYLFSLKAGNYTSIQRCALVR